MPINNTKIKIMGHVIGNYPSAGAARDLIRVMVSAGVQTIEIQIPFSEPMADGPMFLHANQLALEGGVKVEDCFVLMREVTLEHPTIDFLFMTYANVVYRLGYEEFIAKAKCSGAKGAIIPDLPFDYAPEFLDGCLRHNFWYVNVIPPNVPDKRIEELCQASSGLIYAVARTGVTGKRTEVSDELRRFLKKLRTYTQLPIACGFGITSRQDIESLAGFVDYAVIGSKGLDVFQHEGLEGSRRFWSDMVGK